MMGQCCKGPFNSIFIWIIRDFQTVLMYSYNQDVYYPYVTIQKMHDPPRCNLNLCTKYLLPVFAICKVLLCDQTCLSRNSYFILFIHFLGNSTSDLWYCQIFHPGEPTQLSAQIASTNWSVHSLGNVCDCPKLPLSAAVNQLLCLTGARSLILFQISLLFQISSSLHLCRD